MEIGVKIYFMVLGLILLATNNSFKQNFTTGYQKRMSKLSIYLPSANKKI